MGRASFWIHALLPEVEDQDAAVREIPLTDIDRNPGQPRRRFDEEGLKSLSDSIRHSGVLTPLIVVETDGRYRLVAGERRLRAALMAGLKTVPCVVRDFTQQQEMEAALVENLQREDLNPMEEAEGIRALMHLIYDEVKAGKTPHPELLYPEMQRLKEEGAEVFLLACTELPLAFNESTPFSCVDPTLVLARAAILAAGGQLK